MILSPRSSARGRPPDAVILERALSFATEAVYTVALQRRRLRSQEPEDDRFVLRLWADLQMLIIMLRRLRRAAELAKQVPTVRDSIHRALAEFDQALPTLTKMRDVGEHIEDYALDQGHDETVSRRTLQVGSWNGTTLEWLGGSLDVDAAMRAAEELYRAIQAAARPT